MVNCCDITSVGVNASARLIVTNDRRYIAFCPNRPLASEASTLPRNAPIGIAKKP